MVANGVDNNALGGVGSSIYDYPHTGLGSESILACFCCDAINDRATFCLATSQGLVERGEGVVGRNEGMTYRSRAHCYTCSKVII